MWVPITLTAAVSMARLACSVACWLMGMCSDRQRGRMAVTLLRAAGPGSSLLDRQPDGRVLIVSAGRPATAPDDAPAVSR